MMCGKKWDRKKGKKKNRIKENKIIKEHREGRLFWAKKMLSKANDEGNDVWKKNDRKKGGKNKGK